MTTIASLGLNLDTSPLDRFTQAINQAQGASQQAVVSFEQLSNSLDKVSQTSTKMQDNLQRQVASQRMLEQANKDAAVAQKMINDAQEVAEAAGNRLISKLQDMIAVYGLTTTEVLRLRAAQLGVSESADPLIAQLEELKTATALFGKEITDLASIQDIANAQMSRMNADRLAQATESYAAELAAFEKATTQKAAIASEVNSLLLNLERERITAADTAAGAEFEAAQIAQAKILQQYALANEQLISLNRERTLELSTGYAKEVEASAAANEKMIAAYEAANLELNALRDEKLAQESAAYAKEVEAAAALAEKQAIQEIAWMNKSVTARIAELDRLNSYLKSTVISPETINATFSQAAQNDLKNYGSLVEQLAAQSAKTGASVKNLGTDATETAGAFDKLSFSNKRATTEMITLGDEYLRGNYSRMASSFGGLVKAVNGVSLAFSGMGVAALGTIATLGLFAYALIKGSQEQKAFNDALITTNDYAGVTSDALMKMAHDSVSLSGNIGQAKVAFLELASSGKFTGENIQIVGNAAVAMQNTVGTSVSETIKEFESLEVESTGTTSRAAFKITDALIKLSEKYHDLDESVLEEIMNLEKEGRQREASTLAIQVHAAAVQKMAEESEANMGFLQRTWRDFKNDISDATDAVLNFGKVQTDESKLISINERIAKLSAPAPSWLPIPSGVVAANQREINVLIEQREKIQSALNIQDEIAQGIGADRQAQDKANIAARQIELQTMQLQKKSTSEAAEAIEKYKQLVADIQVVNPTSALVQPDVVKAQIEAIEKAHTAAAIKGSDDRQALLQKEIQAQEEASAILTGQYKTDSKVYEDLNKTHQLSDQDLYTAKVALINADAAQQKEHLQQILLDLMNFHAKAGEAGNVERANNLAQQQAYQAKILELDSKTVQARADAYKVLTEAVNKAEDSVVKQFDSAESKLDAAIQKQKEYNAQIGMSKEQIDMLKAAQQDQLNKEQIESAKELQSLLENKDYTANLSTEQINFYQRILAYMDQEILKRKTLSSLSVEGAVKQNQVDMAKEAAQAWSNAAKNIGNDLTEAFGTAGTAIGGMTAAFAAFASATITYNQTMQQLQQSNPDPTSAAYVTQAQNAWATYTTAQIKSYADMATSAEKYFNTGSTGYEILKAVSTVYHLAEIAMEAQTLAVKLTSYASSMVANKAMTANSVVNSQAAASADGTAAFAKTLASVPYPYNLIAGATVVAALVAAGVAMSGGSSAPATVGTAAYDQKMQGTGTVLGDTNAQSTSIASSITLLAQNSNAMLPLTTSMAESLKSIQSAIAGVINIVLEGSPGIVTGNNLGPLSTSNSNSSGIGKFLMNDPTMLLSTILPGLGGGDFGKIANALTGDLFGKSSSSVTDSGLTLNGTVGNLAQGQGVGQYANVQTNSSSLFGLIHSSSNSTQTAGIDPTISNQFALIFQGLTQALGDAAPLLGKNATDIENAINGISISTNISLKGLTGTALTNAINAALSADMDAVAAKVYPELAPFQQVGEGMAATVVRIANAVSDATGDLQTLGINAVKYTDVLNKQGDIGAQIVQQSISAVEKLKDGTLSGIGQIIVASNSTADAITTLYQSLLKLRTSALDVGLSGNINANQINGAGGVSNLQTGLSNFLQDYFTPVEQASAALKDLQIQFTTLGVKMPDTIQGFRNLIEGIDTSTAAGSTLQGQLLNLSGAFFTAMQNATALTGTVTVSSATNDLTNAYNSQVNSINSLISSLTNFATSVTQFKNELNLGSLSPLTPEQKYAAAKAQYEATLKQAQDTNPADATATTAAQGQLQSSAQAFLTASQAANASNAQYTADFNAVQSDMSRMAAFANTQVSQQEQNLSLLNQQVQGLITINNSVLTVAKAIAELQAAMTASSSVGGGSTGGVNTGGNSTSQSSQLNALQVDSLYSSLLGRAPDSGALTNATAFLNNGGTTAQLAANIEKSPEYAVDQLYQSIFGKGSFPTIPEVQADVAFLKNGGTLSQLAIQMQNHTDGSHANGLDYVPFNGYKAELHTGEGVLTASQNIDYKSMGTANTVALVSEIKSLNNQISQLRDEQKNQTNQLMLATHKAGVTSGTIAADGAISAVQRQVWADKTAVKTGRK